MISRLTIAVLFLVAWLSVPLAAMEQSDPDPQANTADNPADTQQDTSTENAADTQQDTSTENPSDQPGTPQQETVTESAAPATPQQPTAPRWPTKHEELEATQGACVVSGAPPDECLMRAFPIGDRREINELMTHCNSLRDRVVAMACTRAAKLWSAKVP
jgi:hypothetical protein